MIPNVGLVVVLATASPTIKQHAPSSARHGTPLETSAPSRGTILHAAASVPRATNGAIEIRILRGAKKTQGTKTG